MLAKTLGFGPILSAAFDYGDVAQVSNLLYRGFPIRRRHHVGAASDWKSGIQQVENLRYGRDAKLRHRNYADYH